MYEGHNFCVAAFCYRGRKVTFGMGRDARSRDRKSDTSATQEFSLSTESRSTDAAVSPRHKFAGEHPINSIDAIVHLNDLG